MFLVLALRADQPLDPAYRFPLRPNHTMVLGRGPEVLAWPTGPTELRISVPDLAMSRRHVELRPDPHERAGLIVTDLGSTNGVFVQGRLMLHGPLRPGELLEIGACTFVLCATQPAPTDEPDCVAFSSTTDPALTAQIARFAGDAGPVALVGEVGPGAQILAEDLHLRRRAPGPFLVWDGAREPLAQARQRAWGGTVFVPDVEALGLAGRHELAGALDLAAGPRLVMGADRLDALSELDLAGMDLKARSIRVPPIAERRHDLGRLLARALESAAQRMGRSAHAIEISRRAAHLLFAHSWPGGFAELQAAVDCAVGVMSGQLLRPADLPSWLRQALQEARSSVGLATETELIKVPGPEAWLHMSSAAERASTLRALLTVFRGNVSALARWVGRSRRQVHRWIREAAIDVDAIRQL